MCDNVLEPFRDRGYVVIPKLFSLDEIETWKDEASLVVDRHRELLGLPDRESMPSADALLLRILCLHQVHKISVLFRALASDRRLTQVLSVLIGPSVKCMQSQLFIKPSGFPGNPWHQDEGPIPTRDRSLVAAWIAIDDSGKDNGGLRVVPRSHLSGYLYPRREHHRPDMYDFKEESFGFELGSAETVEVSPGSVVFFSGYLVHGSTPNQSSYYRRAITFHYMNSYSQLPWRGGQSDYRDVLVVLGRDPYQWKGYADLSVPHLRRWPSSERARKSDADVDARGKIEAAMNLLHDDDKAAITLLREAMELLGE